MHARWTLLCVAVVLTGCQKSGTPTAIDGPAKPAPAAPLDPWVLTTLDPNGDAPAFLSNGQIGVRVARTGGGLDYEGKPLGCFMIDEYETSGEEKILPLPHPLLISVAIGNDLYNGQKEYDFLKSGGSALDPRQGAEYRQSLDMRTGVLTTAWTQVTEAGGKVQVTCETAVHPERRILGQRWVLKMEKKASFSFRSLDYGGPNDEQVPIGQTPDGRTYLSASSKRVVTTTTRLTGGDRNAGVEYQGFHIEEGTAEGGKTVTFERVLAFGERAKTPIPVGTPERVRALAPATPSFSELSEASRRYWAERWKTDIVIDGPVEDQQAVHSFLYYLQSSIGPYGGRSVSPFALSDTTYNGHVFWDADIWVLPALAMVAPDVARAIPSYRVSFENHPDVGGPPRKIESGIWGAAMQNYRDWQKAGRPTASGSVPAHPLLPQAGDGTPVKYPWESSVTGGETVPGPSRFEDHITGSVAWGVTQASAFGLIEPDLARQVARGAATFYAARSIPGPDGREIRDVVSPDENHTGDNDLYTNLLAQWTMNGRTWSTTPKTKFHLPHDAQGLLTYDDDRMRGYKQAAAVLSVYPLQYPAAEVQARTMMERFAGAVIKNGPAMTDSVHATIWARLGEAEKAYDAWHASWQPFTRNPLMLFSEKRTKSVGYFTTGAGGSLQTVVYGFLGMRVDSKKQPGAAWSAPLLGDYVLSVKPNLPPQWKSVKFRNFSVRGRRYTLTATHDPHGGSAATVTQGE